MRSCHRDGQSAEAGWYPTADFLPLFGRGAAGVQLIAPRLRDAKLLGLASVVELLLKQVT